MAKLSTARKLDPNRLYKERRDRRADRSVLDTAGIVSVEAEIRLTQSVADLQEDLVSDDWKVTDKARGRKLQALDQMNRVKGAYAPLEVQVTHTVELSPRVAALLRNVKAGNRAERQALLPADDHPDHPGPDVVDAELVDEPTTAEGRSQVRD